VANFSAIQYSQIQCALHLKAFNKEIADWAVREQKFGGPHFKPDRMTWRLCWEDVKHEIMYVFVVCSCILHHFSMFSREIKSLNQGLNHLWHGFFTVLGMASKIAIKTLGIVRGVLSLMTGILHKTDCETLLLEPSC